MGVDHGLQGKESRKSKDKRAKKATHNKHIALAALVGGKKKEVIFNDEQRVEWLTGFRKRKQQRRNYGLAMQLLKDKKTLKDNKKNVRSKRVPTALQPQSEDEETETTQSKNAEETNFDDDTTTAMFGGVVSVVVDTGIAAELDMHANPDLTTQSIPKSKLKKQKSEFEKAMLKAKESMKSKYAKAGGKKRLRKADKTKLLHKALGALGTNIYKGKQKKK